MLSHSVVSESLYPLGYSPPVSSVHGISQARILKWVAISSSRGLNLSLLCLLHWQVDSLPACHLGNPNLGNSQDFLNLKNTLGSSLVVQW